MQSSYAYINDIGERKIIYVEESDKVGMYTITIWSVRTGDFCGTSIFTRNQLKDFLNHYGVEI